jgi:hypothetical protein
MTGRWPLFNNCFMRAIVLRGDEGPRLVCASVDFHHYLILYIDMIDDREPCTVARPLFDSRQVVVSGPRFSHKRVC